MSKGSMTQPRLRYDTEHRVWRCSSRWKLDKDLVGVGYSLSAAYKDWLYRHPWRAIINCSAQKYYITSLDLEFGKNFIGRSFVSPALAFDDLFARIVRW